MKERVIKQGLHTPLPSTQPGPSYMEKPTRRFSQLGKTPAESQAHPIHQGSRTDPAQVLENHTENGTTKRCLEDTWDWKEKKSLGVAGEVNQQLSDLLLFQTGTWVLVPSTSVCNSSLRNLKPLPLQVPELMCTHLQCRHTILHIIINNKNKYKKQNNLGMLQRRN